MGTVAALQALSRTFGAAASRDKQRLLRELGAAEHVSAARLRRLGDTVEFMRAYPDDAAMLHALRALLPKLPETDNVYAYSYAVLLRLTRIFPGRLTLEWDKIEDGGALLDALELLVPRGECQGLEDSRIGLREWIDAARAGSGRTDLEFVLDLLEASLLPPPVRVFLFEHGDLPVRYRGPGRARLGLPSPRVRYQRRDLPREQFPLVSRIRRPLARVARGGQPALDLALEALCARNFEIYPLIYGSADDVILADCGRGFRVLLSGTMPEWRSALESIFFFLVFKNGVPMAYGPAAAFGGCCELGVNLFPEFRGGETRYLYAQILRVLHHRLGVDYFLLVRYAMGEDNADALRSGAFWFYRKLGFRAANPEVEALAASEEARMAAQPGYRSDLTMLRRLSHTEAFLDLSGGRRAPLDFGKIGMAQTRHVAARFGGDRRRADETCSAQVGRLLGVGRREPALQLLAPLLSAVPDLARWRPKEKKALARFVRAKGARSEAAAARLSRGLPRFLEALRALSASGDRSPSSPSQSRREASERK